MKFTKAELKEILNEYKDKTQNIEELDDFRVAVPPVILKSLIESVIGLSEALEKINSAIIWSYSDDSLDEFQDEIHDDLREALEKWGVGEED